MKKEVLKYIISVLFLSLVCIIAQGQEREKEQNQNDDLFVQEEIKEPLQLKGISFGVNIGRFSDYIFMPERISYESALNINISNKFYGVIEAGYATTNLDKDNYNYLSEGYFVKVGMDKNLLKKYPSDFLGIGFRIGNSQFSHSASNIVIESEYWNATQTSVENTAHSLYWFEISFGIKAEIFTNLYLGWSGLVKIKMTGIDDAFTPYNIPGFGKYSGVVKLGVNYYIYYQIPFNRK
jgi:Domain of unknown function (DUF6048)